MGFGIVATLEVEDGDVYLGIGTTLALGFLEIVFRQGVVLFGKEEKARVVEHVRIVGVEVAGYVEVAFGLVNGVEIEGHSAGIVPCRPFLGVVLGGPFVVFQFGVVIVVDIGGIHQLVK